FSFLAFLPLFVSFVRSIVREMSFPSRPHPPPRRVRASPYRSPPRPPTPPPRPPPPPRLPAASAVAARRGAPPACPPLAPPRRALRRRRDRRRRTPRRDPTDPRRRMSSGGSHRYAAPRVRTGRRARAARSSRAPRTPRRPRGIGAPHRLPARHPGGAPAPSDG